MAACGATITEDTVEVAHSEEFAILDTAQQVVQELKKEELVLAENDFGALKLKKDTKTSQKAIEQAFPDLKVLREVGHQDGPDFIYYHLKDDSLTRASFKMFDYDENLIDRILIEDSTIKDEYGMAVGTTYSRLKKTRPALETVIGDHMVFYVTEVGSPIGYEIWGNTDSLSIDINNYWEAKIVESEISDWKVTRLLWINPNF